MRQAIRSVSKDLGPDAVIISNRKVVEGIEVVAAIDFDESLLFSPEAAEPRPELPDVNVLPEQATEKNIYEKPVADVAAEAAAAIAAANNDQSISLIKKEMDDLRQMLESRLAGLAWSDLSRSQPVQAEIIRQLVKFGFAADFSKQQTIGIANDTGLKTAWNKTLARIAGIIPLDKDDILDRGGFISLVGPTGVGKTTTIAKLAAKYVLRYGQRGIALVTTDNYRIGAHEQLRTYGRILGIPVYATSDAHELADTINILHDKNLVLIDTAGVGQRDERLHQHLEMIQSAVPNSHNYLVFSANSQADTYREIIKAYGSISLSGCIITKLDEATRFGDALSVVIKNQLPIAYISDGQRVPEDIHKARSRDLIVKAVSMTQKQNQEVQEELFEQVFRGYTVNANV